MRDVLVLHSRAQQDAPAAMRVLQPTAAAASPDAAVCTRCYISNERQPLQLLREDAYMWVWNHLGWYQPQQVQPNTRSEPRNGE